MNLNEALEVIHLEEDIINWSKDMFEGIVGNESDVEKVVNHFKKQLLL